jgi:hypothetical protein
MVSDDTDAPVVGVRALSRAAALKLGHAVDAVLVARGGLEEALGADRPPHTATTAEALAHYGGAPCLAVSLWLIWRPIARLELVWDDILAETRPALNVSRRGTTT